MSDEIVKDALEKCAHAFTAINDWLGSASTRQYAMDAVWRAEKALNAAGVPVVMRTDSEHWRGSVFRALEKCGLGWTGYEDDIRFRLAGQPNWSTAAGPKLEPFLKGAFELLGMARGMLIERPGSYYWLQQTVALMIESRLGMEIPAHCPNCGRDRLAE